MNEFKEILREAFMGEAPYDPEPGRAALEESLRQFEGRDRVTRVMMWFAVGAMTLLAAWSAWGFFRADASTPTRDLLLYVTGFLFGCQGVGWAKMFLFTSQLDLRILKELKRVQLALVASGREET